jgi:uncharacterized delta-60 repeat protein
MNTLAVSKRGAVLVCAALLVSSALSMAQAGSLDPTFGTGGIVTTPNTGTAVAMAIQSDGKILVAGSVSLGGGALRLARYNTNGSLDSAFGSGGIVSNNDGPAFGMALQSDGKIVVGAIGTEESLNVLRFDSNGSLDATFGTDGTASFTQFGLFFTPTAGGVVVQANGDIVVAANPAFSGSVLLRLLTNGQLDSSFGTGGAAGLLFNPQTLVLLSSGKFLVVNGGPSGICCSLLSASSVSTTRYNSSGSLDTTFGVNGQAPTQGLTSAIVPLSNGKIVMAGALFTAAPAVGGIAPQGFALVRDTSDGTIDGSFGTRGGVVTPFPENAYSAALAVAVQSSGDVVAAGETAANSPAFGPEPASFALARYTSTGQLDTTFGTGGLVTTAFGTNTAFVSALAIQSDSKIVAVGSSGTGNGFTLARYLGQ